MIRTWRARVLGVAMAALAGISLACGFEGPDAPDAVARDSAGIRIIELGPMPEGPGDWSIDPDPVLQAGWAEGDPEFQFIRSGVLADGRAIVGDMRMNAVTVLPLDGGEVLTLGGPGEGPGEFTRVGHVLAPVSDSVLVSDSGNLRVTWFADGEYAFDRRFESMVAEAVYEPVSRSPQGSFILIPSAFALSLNQEPGWKEYPILGTRDFTALDTLASLPLMHFRDRDSRNPVAHRGIVFRVGDGFGYARTDRPEVIWRDGEGAVTQIVRWEAELREATDADWADWERTYRSRSSPGGDPETYEQRIRDYREDFGGTIPLLDNAHGDDRGDVWLAEHTFAGFPDAYQVLSSSGEWIGRVDFPRPILIHDIREDLVLGVERDELDIQGIAVYRIDRSGG